jgi:hypothetical protein
VFALYDVGVNVAIVVGLTAAAFASPPDGRAPLISLWMIALAVVGAWWALTADRRDPASSYAVDPLSVAARDPAGEDAAPGDPLP